MASGGRKTIDSSAIVDMEVIESDESDYEVDFSGNKSLKDDSAHQRDVADGEPEDREDDVKGQISKGVATYMWEEGRQRARKAFSLYANIDILRPYYDVEPHQVRLRLIGSLVPQLTVSAEGRVPKVPRELYGPTMLVFTLIAMLLYQMKSSGHIVQEGTLMGTAFATCFGYWFGVASLVWVFSYALSTRIAMTQILHTLGYALFGHCIVLFLTTLIHPAHTHIFFYALWLSFGGLSTLKMASVLMSRTPRGRSQKLLICAIVGVVHLVFLLYLHFAYHRVVEDVSHAFNNFADEHNAHAIPATLTHQAADAAVAVDNSQVVGDSVVEVAMATVKQAARRVARSNSSVLQRLAAQHDNASMQSSNSTRLSTSILLSSSNNSFVISHSQ